MKAFRFLIKEIVSRRVRFHSKSASVFAIILTGILVLHGLASAETVKVGAVLPLTGWAAVAGTHVLEGAKIAVDKINGAGGAGGAKIKLIAEDGKADPSESLNATQKLIVRDKVSVMFGAWLSSATLAIIPVIESKGVPLVVETSGHYKITHPVNPWVFRFSPMFSQEAAAAEKCLLKLGFKKIAFLAQDNDWGRGSVEEYRKLLNRLGAETVMTEYMDAVTIDFYPMLTKIKNSEADSILVTTDIPGVSKLLQQHKELGLTQKVMSTGGSNWTDAIIRIAGAEAADGSYHDLIFAGFAPESAPNPIEAKAFVEEWKKRELNWDGVVEGARGYDAIYTIAEAIRLAKGSDERAKIRKALEAVDIKGITAHIKWDAFHDAKPNVLLVQIKDGKSAIFNCE